MPWAYPGAVRKTILTYYTLKYTSNFTKLNIESCTSTYTNKTHNIQHTYIQAHNQHTISTHTHTHTKLTLSTHVMLSAFTFVCV